MDKILLASFLLRRQVGGVAALGPGACTMEIPHRVGSPGVEGDIRGYVVELFGLLQYVRGRIE